MSRDCRIHHATGRQALLRAALLADLEPELTRAERVAVLLAAGYRRSEILRMLADDTREIDKALRRVKNAAKRLDAGDASSPG